MIISRLFISGYKNLLDCDFRPQGIRAITGCNGSGKSNILEVLPFVAGLHYGSDEFRNNVLKHGACPNGTWFPISLNPDRIKPFEFTLECNFWIEDVQHFIEYSLKFESLGIIESPYHQVHGANISSETIKTKIVGASGASKTVLTRNSNSEVTVFGGKSKRAKTEFKCKVDMCALQALEVREADEFNLNFPALACFRSALLSTELVRLNSETFRNNLYAVYHKPLPEKIPGAIIDSYDPYPLLREIEKDQTNWADFQRWLKQLVDVTSVVLFESKDDPTPDQASQIQKRQYVFAEQHGRLLAHGELSMGGTVAIAFLTALYTLLGKGGAALFEEPENYLHPKAVVELVKLFREFGQKHTVIFSTHSPVALNSMKPEEVSVMSAVGDGFVTMKNVSDIKEAMQALDRGFFSFGDLLQTDYATK